jgi:hypothetical protein
MCPILDVAWPCDLSEQQDTETSEPGFLAVALVSCSSPSQEFCSSKCPVEQLNSLPCTRRAVRDA